MAYLGPVPSEHSSGASIKLGGLTKAGNGAARRLLIEAAWCYRFPARVSRELLLRQEAQPKPIREIAWKAQLRLCARYRKLARTGKAANVVTAAIARELAGFIWTIARRVPVMRFRPAHQSMINRRHDGRASCLVRQGRNKALETKPRIHAPASWEGGQSPTAERPTLLAAVRWRLCARFRRFAGDASSASSGLELLRLP
jgi:hypothetical protein